MGGGCWGGVVFPHHDPRNAEDRGFFQRAVERFRLVLQDPRRKLLVMAHPVASCLEAKVIHAESSGGCSVSEVKGLFADLQAKGVRNFELVVVYLMRGTASVAGSSSGPGKKAPEPKVRPLFDSGAGERLVIFEMHCVGHCTGLVFKIDADEKALRALLFGKDKRRKFALPDPLPAAPGSLKGRKR